MKTLLFLAASVGTVAFAFQADRPTNAGRQFQLRNLQRVVVTVKGKKIPTWVMDTFAKRQEGMMFLTEREVRPNEGMIFVFRNPEPQGFWMHNTVLPLDLVFLDGKGKVLNIGHGRPFDESPIRSSGPAKYVLELRAGGAKAFGITPGVTLFVPATVRAKE